MWFTNKTMAPSSEQTETQQVKWYKTEIKVKELMIKNMKFDSFLKLMRSHVSAVINK